jgi:hypothetical protein
MYAKDDEQKEIEHMDDLADKIYQFIEKYAKVSPAYNGNNEKYTNPDVCSLLSCANSLKKGQKPKNCFSSWKCSGAYEPKWSTEGEEEHDQLIKEIYKIQESIL